MKRLIHIGIDIGSTTVKVVALDENNEVIEGIYKRHFSNIKSTIISVLNEIINKYPNYRVTLNVSGSAGISVSKWLDKPFVQEVIAATTAIEKFIPQTDVAIELGGEDAKITYFRGVLDQRMNGMCAGGTGAFIDQIAVLLKTDAFGLNELAKAYNVLYPIAARCGVFAKTDVQALLNEGATKEDIAASVFQAVVNQTISGLACGTPIKGNVAFLGGPLYFLSELKKRFIETLNLKESEIIFPPNSQLYVAIGAALKSKNMNWFDIEDLKTKFELFFVSEKINKLEPLFLNEKEIQDFYIRHKKQPINSSNFLNFKGKCFLGIDGGSTTTKLVLVDEEGEIVYSYYGSNRGTPVDSVVRAIKEMYYAAPKDIQILNSVATGYGEDLIKSALGVDYGEVETIAHYKAAQTFLPDVEFILDIGGQDMKCLKIKEGRIESIMLNEACSAGCGSFVDTFANSLNISIKDFVNEALRASNPVDLGSKCTVFMNSKVKQAQKDGATIGDISAGLSYSILKNALYKVIKIKNIDDLGKKIIVQGGAFLNDAILRSFEKLLGLEVVRPNISGLMGAYGAALIAKEKYTENYTSKLIDLETLKDLKIQISTKRCQICSNACLLTVNDFSDGRKHISGNKCERGVGTSKAKQSIPNLFEYKYNRIFDYKPLSTQEAIRGTIGIPRVLNTYENYPFWYKFFTELKFKVELSSHTTKNLYKKGMDTIPSESICYPAKLVHGHIIDLLNKGVKIIFYPCITFESKEFSSADNNFNCPIVTSYPEVIKNNIELLKEQNIRLMSPFITFNNKKMLENNLVEEFKGLNISRLEIHNAICLALDELKKVRKDIEAKGEEVVEYLEKTGKKGIVLAGRPYHIDREINHNIPQIINDLDMAVLTEDSIAHLGKVKRLRVVDQWKYHSRLYRAASFVRTMKNLELVQLNSFGCGLDAVTIEQVEEILQEGKKVHTVLKIDEGENLGTIKIRLRSLKATIKDEVIIEGTGCTKKYGENFTRKIFTRKMKKTHTILVPQMSPIHFQFIEEAFKVAGYNLEVLPAVDNKCIDVGLKYVNNDSCYPSIIVVGQLIEAIKSGKYDLKNTSIMITQTAGACRATNYIAFLRKALKDAGFSDIPVISLNFAGLEKNPGFKFSLGLIHRAIMGIIYGDLLMKVLLRIRPYEKIKGSANLLYNVWVKKCKESLRNANFKEFEENIINIVKDFEYLKINKIEKQKVGLVGEILVKYHPIANNNIIDIIESEGAEAINTDLMNFILYSLYRPKYENDLISNRIKGSIRKKIISIIENYRKVMIEALTLSQRFTPPHTIYELANKASKVISLENRAGEGWLLTGEMIEYIENGVDNVICMQPFGCLPNHITGRGATKEIKNIYPKSNIIALDYDPGVSEVNQLNRIKLMLSASNKENAEVSINEVGT